MKKVLSFILIFTLMFSVVALSRSLTASAALGDGDKLSVKINLEVGTGSGADFTPITKGETFKKGDKITVRISPKSDFLCGASCYVVMFDKAYYSIQGKGKMAFTANKNNSFYDQVASGYSAATAIPDRVWPSTFKNNENHSVYTVVKVNNTADSTSNNGGRPGYLPGEWLFEFKLSVLKDIKTGANARIFMDSRWFRSPGNTAVDGYFAKVEKEDDLASSGSSTIYKFKYDFSDANVTLPLLAEQVTLPSTKPTPTTTTVKPGTTELTKPGATTTKKPLEGTTAKPTTTRVENVTDKDGSNVTETDKDGSTVNKTTVIYDTVTRVENVTDKDGVKVTEKDKDGSTVYKTTVIYEKVVRSEQVTNEDGEKVFVTDEAGSTIYQTTLIYETLDSEELAKETDEDGNTIYSPDGEPKTLSAKKVILIILIVVATLGAAALIINVFGKKK
ncbi:MAG TPA: hypothetical protein VFD23_01810 [Clostridia bacterium]|nr:hypothetical protein [Clostridia bacterium]